MQELKKSNNKYQLSKQGDIIKIEAFGPTIKPDIDDYPDYFAIDIKDTFYDKYT